MNERKNILVNLQVNRSYFADVSWHEYKLISWHSVHANVWANIFEATFKTKCYEQLRTLVHIIHRATTSHSLFFVAFLTPQRTHIWSCDESGSCIALPSVSGISCHHGILCFSSQYHLYNHARSWTVSGRLVNRCYIMSWYQRDKSSLWTCTRSSWNVRNRH